MNSLPSNCPTNRISLTGVGLPPGSRSDSTFGRISFADSSARASCACRVGTSAAYLIPNSVELFAGQCLPLWSRRHRGKTVFLHPHIPALIWPHTRGASLLVESLKLRHKISDLESLRSGTS